MYHPSKEAASQLSQMSYWSSQMSVHRIGGNREVNRGWTEARILQFNELCKIIKEDREAHGNADKELLEK